MSADSQGPRSPVKLLTAREWLAVVLCVLGVATMTTGAWLMDPSWGLAVLGVNMVLFGILLGSAR